MMFTHKNLQKINNIFNYTFTDMHIKLKEYFSLASKFFLNFSYTCDAE